MSGTGQRKLSGLGAGQGHPISDLALAVGTLFTT